MKKRPIIWDKHEDHSNKTTKNPEKIFLGGFHLIIIQNYPNY